MKSQNIGNTEEEMKKDASATHSTSANPASKPSSHENSEKESNKGCGCSYK